jgi:uncharacterized protein with HEPN domain
VKDATLYLKDLLAQLDLIIRFTGGGQAAFMADEKRSMQWCAPTRLSAR